MTNTKMEIVNDGRDFKATLPVKAPITGVYSVEPSGGPTIEITRNRWEQDVARILVATPGTCHTWKIPLDQAAEIAHAMIVACFWEPEEPDTNAENDDQDGSPS